MLNKYHLKTFMVIISIINYAVIIYFIYRFYTNYKKINAIDSVNHLLKNIIDSRKTVKQYVTYNLLMIGFILIVAFVAQTMYEPKLQEIINRFGENSNKGYVLVFGIYFIFILVFTFIIWLFYRLIYGFFIKRLMRNYNELQKIEY
jgi:type II secretory pathway component PulF